MTEALGPDAARKFVLTIVGMYEGCDFQRLEFPVSRRCTAKIEFSMAPGLDEWDALLVHIAFYKTWFKEDPKLPPSASDVADAVMKALGRGDHAASEPTEVKP